MEEPKSKSALKREAEELQQLAIALSKLPESLFKQIPLSDELRHAIIAYKQMTAHGARRRQAQLLGKLMREVDPEPIKEAYQTIQQQFQKQNQQFHQVEAWRDRLLMEDRNAVTEFINCYPHVSSQELRQLLSNAKKTGAHKPLFQFLKTILNKP